MLVALGLVLLGGVTNPPGPAAGTTAAAFCANSAWRGAFPEEGFECVATQHGVILAPPERAKSLAPVLDEAGGRYATHFARPVQPMAVVASSGISGPQTQFLRQHGLLGFPWPELSSGQSGQGGAGAASSSPGGLGPAKQAGVLSHELAHFWFKAWYDTGQREGKGEQYGSSAPDWLDETAAILNENDVLTAERRAGLASLLRGDRARLRPLSEYLNMLHPGTGGVGMRRSAGSPGSTGVPVGNEGISVPGATPRTIDPNNLPPGAIRRPDGSISVPLANPRRIDPNNLPPGAVRRPDGSIFIPATPEQRAGTATFVISGQADAETSQRLLPFYIQSRAFADFLLEKAGNPRIMMEIATGLRNGQSFEQWLGANGRRHGLPTRLASLSRSWEAWLRQKAAAQPRA